MNGTRVWAGLLPAVGSMQRLGNVPRQGALQALAAATHALPAPRVFAGVQGLETCSTRPFLCWRDAGAIERERPLLRELGTDPVAVSAVALRYEALPGSSLGDLPTRIDVPLAP